MNKQKKTFTTFDISAIVKSLRNKIVGLRYNKNIKDWQIFLI